MKKADEILGKTESGLPQPSWISATPIGNRRATDPEAPRQISNHTKTLVNMIFARFMAIYGHKFKSCFETEQEIKIAKREWALSVEGISEGELVEAINRCKETLAWMPTVSEFLALVEQLKGDRFPSVMQAYQEACRYADRPSRHHWSCLQVYRAGRETGWFLLRTEDEAVALPRFRYYYQQICAQADLASEQDEDIPPPLPKNSAADSAFDQIKNWSNLHGVDYETACQLLFYLTLPANTEVRNRYRKRSIEQAHALGVEVELP